MHIKLHDCNHCPILDFKRWDFRRHRLRREKVERNFKTRYAAENYWHLIKIVCAMDTAGGSKSY